MQKTKPRLNVLLLSQFLSTTKGGGEYVFSLVAKNLAEKGHRVFVITNKVENEQYPEHKNITIHKVLSVIKYAGGMPPTFSDNIRYAWNAFFLGKKIIKKQAIDVIHSNNFAPALAGSLLSWFASIPHVTTVHDVFSLCGKDYWEKWGKQSGVSSVNVKLAPLFEKFMTKLSHRCVHTVSEATKDDLLKFGEKKPIHVIPNSVDVNVQTTYDIDQNSFVYVGRLVFYKNLEIVINSMNIVKKTNPKISLTIVGDGPHKINLKNYVKKLSLEDSINFAGHLSAKKKTEEIAKSNALLLPSLCEGFGLVILEAFAQFRPVIVSDLRPLSDIVKNGQNGYTANPHDENAWAEKLLMLANNPESSNKMGMEGHRNLKEMYSQESMINKVVEMYGSVLNT